MTVDIEPLPEFQDYFSYAKCLFESSSSPRFPVHRSSIEDKLRRIDEDVSYLRYNVESATRLPEYVDIEIATNGDQKLKSMRPDEASGIYVPPSMAHACSNTVSYQ